MSYELLAVSQIAVAAVMGWGSYVAGAVIVRGDQKAREQIILHAVSNRNLFPGA